MPIRHNPGFQEFHKDLNNDHFENQRLEELVKEIKAEKNLLTAKTEKLDQSISKVEEEQRT